MTDDAFWDLAAKVAALETLIEILIVDQLAQQDDPAGIAEEITKSAFQTEEKVRRQVGENPQAMKVTEGIVSLMDRAVKRAVASKRDRPRSSRK
jgi:hypothetical protein